MTELGLNPIVSLYKCHPLKHSVCLFSPCPFGANSLEGENSVMVMICLPDLSNKTPAETDCVLFQGGV